MLPTSVAELGQASRWSESSGFERLPSASSTPQWSTTLAVHYLLFRCLLEDRLGRPRVVRRLRKEAFNLMDEAAEKQIFAETRQAGGLQEVSPAKAKRH